MRIAPTIASSLAVLSLAGCLTTQPVGTESVGPGYVIGGGTFDTGGGITAVARVFERGGVAVICGAWATDRQSTQSVELNRWVIEAGAVDMGGDRLVQNLYFMRRVPYSANISGEQANCVTAGKAWKPDYDGAEPRLRFPRMVFATDDLNPSNNVTFRPGPRDNILR